MSKILIDEAVVRQAQMYFNMIATGDNLDWIKHQAGQQSEALRQALKQPAPAQEPDPDELTIAYMSGLYEGKKIGAKEEREACAKACEEVERKATKQPPMVGQGCQACAAAIRARGNT